MSEDYDDYDEPQPAELSGPVGTTRTRERRVAPSYLSEDFITATLQHFYVGPFRTGPP